MYRFSYIDPWKSTSVGCYHCERLRLDFEGLTLSYLLWSVAWIGHTLLQLDLGTFVLPSCADPLRLKHFIANNSCMTSGRTESSTTAEGGFIEMS
jgi:hypothetical protein